MLLYKRRKSGNMSKRKIIFIVFLISIPIIIFIVIANKNNNLKLIGSNKVEINLLEDYIEEGVTYKNEDITSKLKIDSNVDNTKIGTYKITYKYEKENKEITRLVIVKDMTY